MVWIVGKLKPSLRGTNAFQNTQGDLINRLVHGELRSCFDFILQVVTVANEHKPFP